MGRSFTRRPSLVEVVSVSDGLAKPPWPSLASTVKECAPRLSTARSLTPLPWCVKSTAATATEWSKDRTVVELELWSVPTGPILPSAAALQALGIDVPALRLELHGYSEKPAERFVFINGHKYREGERLTEGPEVVTVEPNGVVLSQQGHRFLLAPE